MDRSNSIRLLRLQPIYYLSKQLKGKYHDSHRTHHSNRRRPNRRILLLPELYRHELTVSEKLLLVYAAVFVGLYLVYKTLQNWQTGFSTGADYSSGSCSSHAPTAIKEGLGTLNQEAKNYTRYFRGDRTVSSHP